MRLRQRKTEEWPEKAQKQGKKEPKLSDALAKDRERIEAARREIDRLDAELVRLLSRRAAHAREIGLAKGRLGEPIYQPEREEQVFARVVGINGGPLDDGAIRRLFERILDEARRLERVTHIHDET
jgi:chorismate mutase